MANPKPFLERFLTPLREFIVWKWLQLRIVLEWCFRSFLSALFTRSFWVTVVQWLYANTGWITLLAVMIWLVPGALYSLTPWITENVSPVLEHPENAKQNWLFITSVCAVVGVLGLCLFWIRSRFSKFYGIGEIAVGLVTAWSSIAKFGKDNNEIVWFGVFSSVYIIVRGLDNYTKKPVEVPVTQKQEPNPTSDIRPGLFQIPEELKQFGRPTTGKKK